MKTVWTIAGSDSGGGAGLQADLKTFHSFGVHGCSAVTALTAQNTVTVDAVQLATPDFLSQQLETLQRDLPPAAIKLGMLGSADLAHRVADFIAKHPGYVVCDPVLVATSGDRLSTTNTIPIYLEAVLPHCALVTPNLVEAHELTGLPVETPEEIERAANRLLATGVAAVLIKGGHANSDDESVDDFFTDGTRKVWLKGRRVTHSPSHGTGCTLAAAIAAAHALGMETIDAVVAAKTYVTRALRESFRPHAEGPGLLGHQSWLSAPFTPADFPSVIDRQLPVVRFPKMSADEIAFYPIVDRAAWVERIAKLGVPAVQIRIKDLTGEAREEEIARAVAFAQRYDCRLFVNDYWELAAKHGAYGVHLGQEDLDSVDIRAVAHTGLRLGVSTHSLSELGRAVGLSPSYLAIGAVFPTVKPMKSRPQGLPTFAHWSQFITCPVIAIGGITLERVEEVYNAGARCFSVIRDVIDATDPEARVQQWLAKLKTYKKPHQTTAV
jgi:hydroxymethylpyrimidine kinase/phosphomethylpyrimidine kinase/thiamine-phosphate diphosphorylase